MDTIVKVDWIIGHPRNPYAPLPGKRERPPSNPTSPERLSPSKSKQQQYLCVILFLGLAGGGPADKKHYPHQPFRWALHHLSESCIARKKRCTACSRNPTGFTNEK
ncbi:uncharacterized protein LOC131569901 isoform X4 [Ammospiza caudacuta]|uniref:uncharacterized protein LOC131569901 isoform X4 n=1 Tax=Ammospiza caudacuta TaxID=2857398 RepID=UPI002738644A|nr:uncharacterized protein LOC131569901 isoform X4 [Ammospiza caudacuta]